MSGATKRLSKNKEDEVNLLRPPELSCKQFRPVLLDADLAQFRAKFITP